MVTSHLLKMRNKKMRVEYQVLCKKNVVGSRSYPSPQHLYMILMIYDVILCSVLFSLICPIFQVAFYLWRPHIH